MTERYQGVGVARFYTLPFRIGAVKLESRYIWFFQEA
jgi:hypothetical protein